MTLLSPFLVATAVQATTPLLLAALAGVLCSRVGVFNMALEGLLLVGAFAGGGDELRSAERARRRRGGDAGGRRVLADPGLWRDGARRQSRRHLHILLKFIMNEFVRLVNALVR